MAIAFAISIGVFVFALIRISRQLHRQQRATANALETTEEEFREMAGNIQEVFWMMDARTKKALYVNQAYEAITGRSCKSLIENPLLMKR